MNARDIVAILAALLIVAGAFAIYPPAALIVAGIAMAVILLVDLEPRRRA